VYSLPCLQAPHVPFDNELPLAEAGDMTVADNSVC
jgi:hypothetical protein